MNKLKNTKKIYDQIEVPDNLSEIIQQTLMKLLHLDQQDISLNFLFL